MKKRILTAFLITALVLSTLGINEIQGKTKNENETIILVSENEADQAVAKPLANKNNMKIITTEWGIYQSETEEKIRQEAPDKVKIVGGKLAVPKKYEENLKEYGIETERITGLDRYRTALNLLQEMNTSATQAIVVHGLDIESLQESAEEAMEKGAILIALPKESYKNYNDISERTNKLLKQKKIENIKINEGPEFEAEELKELIKDKEIEIEKNDNESFQNKTLKALNKAEALVKNATEKSSNITHPGISNPLNNAKRFLNQSKIAYNQSNYGYAYGKANAALNTAREVIRKTYEIEEEYEEEGEDITERIEEFKEFLNDIEENYNPNQTTINKIRNQFNNTEQLLEEGKIEEARNELKESRRNIKELYKEYRKQKEQEEDEEELEELNEELQELEDEFNELQEEFELNATVSESIQSDLNETRMFLENNDTQNAEINIEDLEEQLDQIEEEYEEDDED